MTRGGKKYLQYHRIIQGFMKYRYDLTVGELNFLTYLYHEGIFNKAQLNSYNAFLTWDEHRLRRMIKDGWIIVISKFSVSDERRRDQAAGKKVGKKGLYYKAYSVSQKGKLMVANYYAMCEGDINMKKMGFVSQKSLEEHPYASRSYQHAIRKMFALEAKIKAVKQKIQDDADAEKIKAIKKARN